MLERIVVDPAVHFGKPCVRGTRITVSDVLELIEDAVPFEQIVARFYPDLTVEDVRACVHYAAAVLRGEETHAGEPSR